MFSFFKRKRNNIEKQPKRSLTMEEDHILCLIKEIYGDQNAESECFVDDYNDAAIFVASKDGTIHICVNLSVVVSRIAKDEGLSDEQIKIEWLVPK